MILLQFHINHNDFFKTVRPTARNPPTYSNWQDLSGITRHEQPVRWTIESELQRSGKIVAFITREAQISPTADREEQESPMEGLPPVEEEMHSHKGDDTETTPQDPTQET